MRRFRGARCPRCHSGALRTSEPGIHNHRPDYGFRPRVRSVPECQNKYRLTEFHSGHMSESSPSTEGRSAERTERGWGAAPAPAVFAHRGPGSPWRAASRPIMRPRVNVPYTFPVGSHRMEGKWGTKDLRRRSGAPLRRGRLASWSRAPCQGTVLYAPNGAPLPLWGSK
jgi:hypothetical protein